MKEITESEFAGVTSKGVVLVDFSAEWCGPCKAMMPTIQRISTDYAGRLSVYTVDTDKSPALASQQLVMSMPTFLLFKDGKVVDRVVGALAEPKLRAKIDAFL